MRPTRAAGHDLRTGDSLQIAVPPRESDCTSAETETMSMYLSGSMTSVSVVHRLQNLRCRKRYESLGGYDETTASQEYQGVGRCRVMQTTVR